MGCPAGRRALQEVSTLRTNVANDITSLQNAATSRTIENTFLYSDSSLGNDSNSGLAISSGTGGSFSANGATITFTATSAAWDASVIGKIVFFAKTSTTDNAGAFLITGCPASNQISYTNTKGTTESFTGLWAVASPKKTLNGVISLIPDTLKHYYWVWLSGDFDLNVDSVLASRQLENYGELIFSGTDAAVTINDNAGSPWVADISSVATIGNSTAGWAINAFSGYIVEALSGICKGKKRTIKSNTASTLTVTYAWSADPGNAQFRIIRPYTTFYQDAGVYNGSFTFNAYGLGLLAYQKICLTGEWPFFSTSNRGHQLYFSQFLDLSTNVYMSGGSTVEITGPDSEVCLTDYEFDPSTFWQSSANRCAPIVQTDPNGALVFFDTVVLHGEGVVAQRIDLLNCSHYKSIPGYNTPYEGFSHGAWVKALVLDNYRSQIGSCIARSDAKFGGHASLPAINMISSIGTIEAGVDISNSPSHGIIVNNSKLLLNGIVTGVGNIGAGVYAYNGSVVNIKSGAAPTISGSVGYLAVTSSIGQECTWEEINAGTPVTALSEMTLVKKI